MFGSSKLKRYTAHSKEGAAEPLILVREGYSILAFIFGFLWLLYHRAWLPALFTFALALLLKWIEIKAYISPEQMAFITLIVQYWIGSEARDWQRDALAKRGYTMTDVVLEDSEERAELRYYERHLMVDAAVAQTTPHAA